MTGDRKRISGLLQDGHAGSFGLDSFVSGGNGIHGSCPDITGEEVDSLHPAALQVDIFVVKIVSHPEFMGLKMVS